MWIGESGVRKAEGGTNEETGLMQMRKPEEGSYRSRRRKYTTHGNTGGIEGVADRVQTQVVMRRNGLQGGTCSFDGRG